LATVVEGVPSVCTDNLKGMCEAVQHLIARHGAVRIAFLQGPEITLNFAEVMVRRLTITGSTLRPQPITAKSRIAEALKTEVWPLLASGRVAPVIDSEFPLEEAAEAMGINVAAVKTLTFGVSALYAGVGGALGAIVVQFVAPDSFVALVSISFLIGIVIGGLASISGVIYGALFIQFVPNIADEISKAAPWAVYGLFLLVFIFLAPRGVAGFMQLLWAKLLNFCARNRERKARLQS